MFALFNLGTQEVLILVVLGGLACAPVVIGLGVLVYVLTRAKDEQRND
jgi:hypothetical protein